MTNIGGPRESKRILVATEMHPKLVYAAPAWARAVLGTERSSAENSHIILNYVDDCCVGPGERPANRLIGEGKAGDLSAPQRAHLYKKPTGNRSREGSHP